jgi:Ca2+-binding RTX toxin-like protein
VENTTGSNHDDCLIGDDDPNVLEGRAGNDALEGKRGSTR